jgi:hypothetical protein
MIDLRLPNITATTEREQLLQIKSYLNQLIPELQFAMSNVSAPAVTSVATATKVVSTAPTNADAQATFNSIKSLIIKSADIVNAYYEEINKRLEGIYVAESDYGIFVKETTADIEANSTNITQNYTNTQEIISEIKTEVSRIDTSAYIKTGYLTTQGDIDIYGVEVGQRTEKDGEEAFDKCARFTADKLEFFGADNQDEPLAYISGFKLYITHAEVTNSLTLGKFKDTVQANGDVVTKWIGG